MAPSQSAKLAPLQTAINSALANNPLRVEQRTRRVDDGAGGLIEQKFKFPAWSERDTNTSSPFWTVKKIA